MCGEKELRYINIALRDNYHSKFASLVTDSLKEGEQIKTKTHFIWIWI